MLTYGLTDVGKPLNLFVISHDKDFTPGSVHSKNKLVILINNGIHPGEPDGIDASMKFSEDILSGKIPGELVQNVVICIIPVYNIYGALNRSCCSRANQNGPKEYGFRANGKNLDLNRDFIKCDSENTRSFTKIFREWDPEILIDTHTSNGADYSYTMTLIATQHNKLNAYLGTYLKAELSPAIFKKMFDKNDEMIHYVNTNRWEETPDNGINGFLETPRFCTGYAALFNTIGFVAETHMLKPFPHRVQSTYNLFHSILEISNKDYERILHLRKKAKADCASRIDFDLQWVLDTTKFDLINFKGFEAKYNKSNVTGLQRLYYDRESPYGKTIKYNDHYKALVSVKRPETYIVPQAWSEVIERIKLNNIEISRLSKDTSLESEVYYIENFNTSNEPYEGHYVHSKTEIRKEMQKIDFYKGDYVIHANTNANRYVVETLEPQGVDSWFNWGFFDAILQQKEWFSSYVFEEKAEQLLKENSSLRKDFENKQKQDTAFAKNAFAQLYFIYKNAPGFEKSFKRYPVARLNTKVALPVE